MTTRISPTVIFAYTQNPQWFDTMRTAITVNGVQLDILHQHDIDGYDCWGFNKDGVDRAGHVLADYFTSVGTSDDEVSPLYEEVVQMYSSNWWTVPQKEIVDDPAVNEITETVPITTGEIKLSHRYTDYTEDTIAQICAHYNAQFVAFMPPVVAESSDGVEYTNWQVPVFYQPKPEKPEYSNYFTVFRNRSEPGLLIADAQRYVTGTFDAIEADSGEIIYSSYRHDHRTSADGTVWIDGGRNYTRSNRISTIHKLKIVDGKFYEV